MVIPYYSFYLYFPWAAWMGSSDRHRQNGLVFHQRLIASAWVAFIIFLLFPVEIELRSQAYGAEGLFGLMMSALHEADAPYNAWPSNHVLLSILVVFFVRFVEVENGTWTAPKAVVIWVSCALLVASTALIKQHYVFDGISGSALAFGLWYGWIRPALN